MAELSFRPGEIIFKVGDQSECAYTVVTGNHFSVEYLRDHVIVRDRGSFLGTLVNGVQIGGRHHVGTADLRIDENESTVGSAESPFRIRATVERQTTGDPR